MTTSQLPTFIFLADKFQFKAARFAPYSSPSLKSPKRGEIWLDGYIVKAYDYFQGKFQLWKPELEPMPPKELI